jgi:hypothetical protein
MMLRIIGYISIACLIGFIISLFCFGDMYLAEKFVFVGISTGFIYAFLESVNKKEGRENESKDQGHGRDKAS